jgi:chemotaxis regulatin CheY-phosphate phosphatase CheZ
MARAVELTNEQFSEIEEALSNNARGRAFLRMRDDRMRVIGANDVQRLMRKLRDEWRREQQPPPPPKHDEATVRILREELREMSAYIHQTRREIAALRPADAGSNRIMAATGELDAIVSATERATSDILNGAERIQTLADRLPRDGETGEIALEIAAQVTEVLTACSFQDITGQRTTKVVNTLRYIEQRVNSMVAIWGPDGNVAPVAVAPTDSRPDAHLMNGPSDGAPSQEEVDALLDQLDNQIGGGAPVVDLSVARAAAAPAAAPPPAAPPSPAPAAAPAPSSDATSSQSDIDALFG